MQPETAAARMEAAGIRIRNISICPFAKVAGIRKTPILGEGEFECKYGHDHASRPTEFSADARFNIEKDSASKRADLNQASDECGWQPRTAC
jgi:hypothetical protein